MAGHGGDHVTLDSGQEEPIRSVTRAVAARRIEILSWLESTGKGVSEQTLLVERAIGQWRVQFKKLKTHFESKVGTRVNQEHRITPWMVSWAAEVLIKFEVWMQGR